MKLGSLILVSVSVLCWDNCNAEAKVEKRCHKFRLKEYNAKQCTTFFGNGNLKDIDLFYKDSSGDVGIHGISKSFHENGQLKGVIKYKYGCPYDTSKGFFPDGSLARITPYKNCKSHGVVKEYYENGQIKSLYNEKNGEQYGDTKMWHPNGQISAHYVYKGGNEIVGKGFSWYEDGTVEAESVYEEDSYWEKKYYKNKIMKSEEYYENKLLMNAKYYDRKGNLMSEIKDGVGTHCYFNEEQNEYSIRFYRGGKWADQMFHNSCEVPEYLRD